MKIKSLLAAVSMVALSATSANAIVVTQTNGTFTTPLALEVNTSTLQVPGTISVLVAPDSGFFNQGIQNTVVVTLPAGMSFNGAVNGSDLVGSGGEAGNIFTGGADNSNTVTFQVAPVTNMTGTYTLNLRVQTTSGYCAAGAGNGINVIVSTPGGAVNNDVDGDNTNTAVPAGSQIPMGPATPLGGCASALNGVVASDENVLDTFIALAPTPTYTTLADGSAAVGAAGPFALGTIQYNTAVAPPLGPVGVDSAGTAMVPADVASVVSTITLPGNPSPGGLTLTASAGTIAPSPAGQAVTWRHTATGAQIVNTPVTISATANAAAPLVALPNMQPSVTGALVTFATGRPASFIANEPGRTGNLDALVRQGETFGFFDWNSGPAIANPTLSVYRVTGLTGPTNYTIQTTNSNSNGLYSGSLTPDAFGEATFLSSTLPVPATTGRFDFQINFETTNAGIDVDRLLLRTGIVTNFGGDANSNLGGFGTATPDFDADNDATPSE